MDKKAWIMITLFFGLLGMGNVLADPAQEAPAEAAPAPVAEAPAEPAPAAEPAAEAAPTPAMEPAPEQPAPVAAQVEDDGIPCLESKDEDGNVVARFHFQSRGGSVKYVEMVGQAIDSTREELHQNVCINRNAPHGVGTLMCSLNGSNPNIYEDARYEWVDKGDAGKCVLRTVSDSEIIEKTYSIKPLKEGDEVVRGNAYVLCVDITIVNRSTETRKMSGWAVYAGGISQISKYEGNSFVKFLVEDDGDFEAETPSDFSHFFGSDEPYRIVKDCDHLDWVGLMNQYYATALKPGEGSCGESYYAAPIQLPLPVTGQRVPGLEVAIGLPDFELAGVVNNQGGVRKFTFEYFAGPKYSGMLGDMMGKDQFRKLDRVMDYGRFYYISKAMNWVICLFHGLFGNWGWAIVAMTFVVRAIIWPLYRKSYVSMKRMSLLQPQMKELKEKYPDDPQRVQMEMMGLYRKYGINPLGGCLPMILQMPIFLSFFWVLQTAAELRGSEWLGWVTDLSMPDTVWEYTMPISIPFIGDTICLNILPFFMITSMFVMMNMTPQAPGSDKMQRTIMRLMPLFFFLFCYNYASALALYWTTTNIISMLQLLIIRRLPMPQLKEVSHKAKGGKKGFMQRMYEAQQAALKEQQARSRR